MATAGTRGPWKADEDRRLLQLVDSFGPRSWAAIAVQLHGRSGKQCRERWLNHLNPDIKKSAWTEEEDALLLELHRQYGNSWAKISKKIPGRTDNAIKNHWNSSLKRIAERTAAGAPTSPTSVLAENESASSSTSTSSRRRTSGARIIGKRRRSRSAREKPLPPPVVPSCSVDASSTLDTEAVIEEVLNRPSMTTPPPAPVPAPIVSERLPPPMHPVAPVAAGMLHTTPPSMHAQAHTAAAVNNYYATMHQQQLQQQQLQQHQQQLMAQHYWAMMAAAKEEPAIAPASQNHPYFDVHTDANACHEAIAAAAIPSERLLENVMENMGGVSAEGAAIRHGKDSETFCDLL